MEYFEQILKEIEININIETDKMLESSKKLQEASSRIEELKKEKEVVLALTNKFIEKY